MKRIGFIVLFAVLAGCGGGGGGGSLPNTAPPTPPPPSSGGGGSHPTASPSPEASPTASPAVSPTPVLPSPTPSPVTVPSPTPRPRLPTPVTTTAVAVQINASVPLNDRNNFLGNPLVFGVRLLTASGTSENSVTTQTSACGSTSCRVSIMAPPGFDTFAITYAVGTTGTTNTDLTPVAYNGSVSAAVSATGANNLAATLLGVPAFYELDANGTAPFSGVMPLAMSIIDDSNSCTPQQVIDDCAPSANIRGAFAAPILLTDTDTGTGTGLSLNGGKPAKTVTVTKASDSISLIIAGNANVSQAYVSPSASFNAGQFGAAYSSMTLTPWATQDTSGLGFTCSQGSCQTTGPGSVTIQ